jgi:hypothetical protein
MASRCSAVIAEIGRQSISAALRKSRSSAVARTGKKQSAAFNALRLKLDNELLMGNSYQHPCEMGDNKAFKKLGQVNFVGTGK